MKIKLLLFGQVAESLGISEKWIEVAGDSVAGDLAGILAREHGCEYLADMHIRYIVNEEFVDDGYNLQDKNEVAIATPFQGG